MDERNFDDAGLNREPGGARAIEQPRNRQLLFLIGALVLAALIALAIWQSTGTRGAERDFANARERVMDKEKEVAEARRMLERRIAELRAVSARADVEAAKLGNTVEEEVAGAIDDARIDAAPDGRTPRTDATVAREGTGAATVYYVRDAEGRFVPVARP